MNLSRCTAPPVAAGRIPVIRGHGGVTGAALGYGLLRHLCPRGALPATELQEPCSARVVLSLDVAAGHCQSQVGCSACCLLAQPGK